MRCILCSTILDGTNKAEEHVIPNALGGRLKTTQATCAPCNSNAGHTIDARLVDALSFLAIALDVPRDRGEHPTHVTADPDTGLVWETTPGTGPRLGPNLRATDRGEGRYEFNLYADTKEEAERRLRALTRSKRNRVVKAGELVGNPVKTNGPVTVATVPTGDADFLRGVAKVAACYAAAWGIELPETAPVIRALRDVNAVPGMIAPARGAVVAVDASSRQPLSHGIYMFAPEGANRLYSLVVLFEAFEFVVLLDDAWSQSAPPRGYYYDLLHGSPEDRPFRVVSGASDIDTWLADPVLSQAQMDALWPRLAYWIHPPNRPELWLRRATGVAWRRFHSELARGADPATAEVRANDEANALLRRYGLEGSITITRGPSPT